MKEGRRGTKEGWEGSRGGRGKCDNYLASDISDSDFGVTEDLKSQCVADSSCRPVITHTYLHTHKGLIKPLGL